MLFESNIAIVFLAGCLARQHTEQATPTLKIRGEPATGKPSGFPTVSNSYTNGTSNGHKKFSGKKTGNGISGDSSPDEMYAVATDSAQSGVNDLGSPSRNPEKGAEDDKRVSGDDRRVVEEQETIDGKEKPSDKNDEGPSSTLRKSMIPMGQDGKSMTSGQCADALKKYARSQRRSIDNEVLRHAEPATHAQIGQSGPCKKLAHLQAKKPVPSKVISSSDPAYTAVPKPPLLTRRNSAPPTQSRKSGDDSSGAIPAPPGIRSHLSPCETDDNCPSKTLSQNSRFQRRAMTLDECAGVLKKLNTDTKAYKSTEAGDPKTPKNTLARRWFGRNRIFRRSSSQADPKTITTPDACQLLDAFKDASKAPLPGTDNPKQEKPSRTRH